MEKSLLSKKTEEHFQGKDAIEHLVDARKRGHMAGSEPHGFEPSGMLISLLDSGKESALVLSFFSFFIFSKPIMPLIALAFGLAIWKFGRSTLLAWSRLEKLHRVTLEERQEIEQNRETERVELKEIYRLKGFEGKLLDDIIEVLMQDDNRLLQVMLEEELGISLQCQEHPLKQGFGALLGASLSSLCIIGTLFFLSLPFAIGVSFILILLYQIILTKKEQNRMIPSIVWTLGLYIMVLAASHSLMQIMLGFYEFI